MADCRKCKHNYKMPGDEPRCNLMCDGESDFEPITKYDQIHAMSIEELAEFIIKVRDCCSTNYCEGCPFGKNGCSKGKICDWLQSEAE